MVLAPDHSLPGRLQEVLFVPGLCTNLFSSGAAMTRGVATLLRDGTVTLLNEDDDVIGRGVYRNGLFELECRPLRNMALPAIVAQRPDGVLPLADSSRPFTDNPSDTIVVDEGNGGILPAVPTGGSANNLTLWHLQLGHMSVPRILAMADGLVDGIDNVSAH